MSCIGICIADYLVAIVLGVFAGSVLNWRIHSVLETLRRKGAAGNASCNVLPARFSVLRAPGRYWNSRMRKRVASAHEAYPERLGKPSEISSLMQLGVDSAQPHDSGYIKLLRGYAAVEAANALSYALVFNVYGWSAMGLAAMGLMTVFIAVAVIDLKERIIPDGITITGILAGLLLGPVVFELSILESVMGVLLGGGLFYAIAVLSRGGMGGGDIKFIAMVGAFVGWKGVLIAIFLGSLAGAVVGIGLMLFKGMRRKTPIPFGPFLVLGAMAALLYGREIAAWYSYSMVP